MAVPFHVKAERFPPIVCELFTLTERSWKLSVHELCGRVISDEGMDFFLEGM
jgi:hypothetical protein